MSAQALLDTLAGLGVRATITPTGALRLAPASLIPTDLLDEVRAHKAELLAYLNRPEPASTPQLSPVLISLLDTLPAARPVSRLYLQGRTGADYTYGLEWQPHEWPPTYTALVAQYTALASWADSRAALIEQAYTISHGAFVYLWLETGGMELGTPGDQEGRAS